MRKTGLLMLLTVCLLFSLQFAVAAEMQAKDVFSPESVLTENKTVIREEVIGVSAGEIVTDFSVSPIKAENGFIYTTTDFSLYGSAEIISIAGEQLNKISVYPGGDSLIAGFA